MGLWGKKGTRARRDEGMGQEKKPFRGFGRFGQFSGVMRRRRTGEGDCGQGRRRGEDERGIVFLGHLGSKGFGGGRGERRRRRQRRRGREGEDPDV